MALNKNGVAKMGGNTTAAIKGYVKQLLDVEVEIVEAKEKHISPLTSHMKDIYTAASSEGFDKKALKECVRKAKMAEDERFEADAYELAWFEGMVSEDTEEEESEIDS